MFSMVIDAYLFICKKLKQKDFTPKMVDNPRPVNTRPVKTVLPTVTVANATPAHSNIKTKTRSSPKLQEPSCISSPIVVDLLKGSSSKITTCNAPNVAMIPPIALIDVSSTFDPSSKTDPEVSEVVEMDNSETNATVKQEIADDDELQVVDLEEHDLSPSLGHVEPTNQSSLIHQQHLGLEFVASTSTSVIQNRSETVGKISYY